MTAHDKTFAAIANTRFDDLCNRDMRELHNMARAGDLKHVDDHSGAYHFTITDDENLNVSASNSDLRALSGVALEILRHAGDGVELICGNDLCEAICKSLLSDGLPWGFDVDGDGDFKFIHPKGNEVSDDVIELLCDLIANSQALSDHTGGMDIRMTTEAAFYATGIAAQ